MWRDEPVRISSLRPTAALEETSDESPRPQPLRAVGQVSGADVAIVPTIRRLHSRQQSRTLDGAWPSDRRRQSTLHCFWVEGPKQLRGAHGATVILCLFEFVVDPEFASQPLGFVLAQVARQCFLDDFAEVLRLGALLLRIIRGGVWEEGAHYPLEHVHAFRPGYGKVRQVGRLQEVIDDLYFLGVVVCQPLARVDRDSVL